MEILTGDYSKKTKPNKANPSTSLRTSFVTQNGYGEAFSGRFARDCTVWLPWGPQPFGLRNDFLVD
jgi:hypothetical protein